MPDWPLHPLADMNSTGAAGVTCQFVENPNRDWDWNWECLGWCRLRRGRRSSDGFLDRQPSSSGCGTPNVLNLSININSLSPLAVRVVRDFSP